MKKSYAHIVLGAGGIGSAAAYWLGRNGASRNGASRNGASQNGAGQNGAGRSGTSQSGDADVLVLEQFRLGHDRGASEDHSRIIRHSYHSTDYTGLTRASYAHWRDLEAETGLDLLRITGGLDLAPSGGAGAAEIASYARALADQGHDHELLDAATLRARWPQWRIGDDIIGLHQAESGILDIRRANSAHVSRALARGVTFAPESPVRKIVPHPGHVEVHTDDEVFEGGTLTVCAGSWTPSALAGLELDIPLTLTQEQVTYFAAADLRPFAPEEFPIWIFHGPDKTFYGFPVYGEAAVKAARDMSERFVTQETRSYTPNPDQTAEVAEFLAEYLPGALGPELVSKTCVYDLTADRNFVLGTVPGHPNIALFVGAGHAAKFASLIGHILADLATTGQTEYPIAAFSLDRPAITDPDYPPDLRFAQAAQSAGPDPGNPDLSNPDPSNPDPINRAG